VTVMWGVLLGLATWQFYSVGNPEVTASVLGHPLIDSILLGLVTAAPVALYSAVESKRAGFEKLSLIARRSAIWFGYGGCIALVIIEFATATGLIEASSPRAVVQELTRSLLILSAASAFFLTSAKLGWILLRYVLGMRTR
jgi:hypothetical protein